MGTINQICGIDVSKSSLDISHATLFSKQIESRQAIPNTLTSIETWLSEHGNKETLYVLEPTGNYSDKIVYCLTQNNLSVSLVPPYQSKSFMQSQGIVSKNDKQSADSLAKMGKSLDLKLYKAPSEDLQKRKQMLQTIGSLKKEERRLLNQLHAMDQRVIQDEASRLALETVLTSVQTQVQILEEKLSEQQQSQEYQKKKKFAMSVIGVGEATADAILLATNCLDDFEVSSQNVH